LLRTVPERLYVKAVASISSGESTDPVKIAEIFKRPGKRKKQPVSSKLPWIICVFIDSLEETLPALNDLRHQSVEPQILAIDNGSSLKNWTSVRKWTKNHDGVLLWRHNPPFPSLAMTWNYALDFVWGQGAMEAMVVNHDVRVHQLTYELLRQTLNSEDALFVSALGVLPEQYNPSETFISEIPGERGFDPGKGGPDFSCYLISKECHEKYRFDENFIPAYCEDLDFHRRMLLGGDGKRIFSINIPFAHQGSGVLRSMTPEKRAALEERISQGSRAYYEKKWGGPVNHEIQWRPFNAGSYPDFITPEEIGALSATTPGLQRHFGPGGDS